MNEIYYWKKNKYLKENGFNEIKPEFKYVKAYENNVMFYTEEHINNHSIEELEEADKKNADYFGQLDDKN